MYRRNYECLLSLDAVLFRSKAFEAGLITGAVKDDLRYLGGGKIHNEELLKMGKGPGGPDSFLLLVKAVRLFGDKYDKQRKDLESVLPVVASSGTWSCLWYRCCRYSNCLIIYVSSLQE